MSDILEKVKQAGRNQRILIKYKIALSILTISCVLVVVSFITGSYYEHMNKDVIANIFEWSIAINFFIATVSTIVVVLFNIWIDKKILS